MQRLFCRIILLLLVVLFFLTVGCEDSSDPYEEDHSDDDDDNDDNDDNNDNDDYPPFNVIYEYVLVDADEPAPNPVTGAHTPAKYNKIPMLRFRQDTGELAPRPVNAIFIMLPGYTAGSSQFTFIAYDLITLAQGDLEVWIPECRTNLLEDQIGMNVAEAEKNPFIAWDYYFEGAEVNGHTFGGWINPASPITEMVSEWDLHSRMKDIHTLVEKIPEAQRATNVFIGGHSRGVRFTQMYAAYEFEDGHIGSDDVAGLVFFDGADSHFTENLTEPLYLLQMDQIQKGVKPRLESQWGGPGIYYQIEFFSMLATDGWGDADDPRVGPDGIYDNYGIFGAVVPLFARGHEVTLTNEAFWGMLLDNDSTIPGQPFFGHMGKLTGGEIGHDFIGDFPKQDGATYSWLRFDEVEPEELMDIQKLFRIIYEGPTDFCDPYYSSRLYLDDNAMADLETQGTWRHDYFHFYTSRVDAPVMALEGMIGAGSGFYEQYRDRMAPLRGFDLPRTDIGFEIFSEPEWGHIEVLHIEADRNPFYNKLLNWMWQWSDGEVSIPAFN